MNLSAPLDIDRPTTEVFAYVREVSHDAQWRTGVVETEFDGTPTRPGTSAHALPWKPPQSSSAAALLWAARPETRRGVGRPHKTGV